METLATENDLSLLIPPGPGHSYSSVDRDRVKIRIPARRQSAASVRDTARYHILTKEVNSGIIVSYQLDGLSDRHS